MINSKDRKLTPMQIDNRLVTLQNNEENKINGVGCSAFIEPLKLIIQGERGNDKKKTNRNARVVFRNCLTGEPESKFYKSQLK